jgi:release factor glutamine methyltransferase
MPKPISEADWSISQALSWACSELSESESASLDSQILLCHVLDCSMAHLMTWPEKPLSETDQSYFQEVTTRRKNGQPIAYIIGYQGFWDLQLKVSPFTLIPRPETELLVEAALELSLLDDCNVLDLGTGTGAIALALASEKPDWKITAIDFIKEAVDLAKQNADLNDLSHINIVQSDWFAQLSNEQFHLIVTNPPYVESQSHYLKKGDVQFEPLTALTSGEDGLNDFQHKPKQVILDNYSSKYG